MTSRSSVKSRTLTGNNQNKVEKQPSKELLKMNKNLPIDFNEIQAKNYKSNNILKIYVGNEEIHKFKLIHFDFLHIQIYNNDTVKDMYQEKTKKQSKSPSYGSKYLKKSSKNKSVLAKNSHTNVLEKNKKPLNFQSNFKNLKIDIIKTNFKFQILIGNSIIEIKSYFGCISSVLLPYYKTKEKQNDIHFLRRGAHELKYSDDMLENICEKLQNTETFKKIDLYSNEEKINLDQRVREARGEMDNFEIDQFLFESFFGSFLPISEFNSK